MHTHTKNYMNKNVKNLVLSLAGAAVGVAATWQGLCIARYVLSNDKIASDITAVVVSDLHSTKYGKSQNELIDAILEQEPDIILIPGDMVDEERDPAPAFTLMKQLVRIAPVFMVTGNHEYYGGRAEDIIREVESFGIKVLFGDCATFTKNGEKIAIYGIEDKYGAKDDWYRQKSDVLGSIDKKRLSVLISHRPDLVDDYNEIAADVTVCGHAHGGQVIIPGILNGLFAPHQGFLPQYAGGRYTLGNTEMIVCRGLMKSMLPRVFNPPELAVIEIKGTKEDNNGRSVNV